MQRRRRGEGRERCTDSFVLPSFLWRCFRRRTAVRRRQRQRQKRRKGGNERSLLSLRLPRCLFFCLFLHAQPRVLPLIRLRLGETQQIEVLNALHVQRVAVREGGWYPTPTEPRFYAVTLERGKTDRKIRRPFLLFATDLPVRRNSRANAMMRGTTSRQRNER